MSPLPLQKPAAKKPESTLTPPVLNLPDSEPATLKKARRKAEVKACTMSVNPDKDDTPPPPPNSVDSAELMEVNLEDTLQKNDLVSKVNDDNDMSMMDISMEIGGTDELSKDSEGFAKCRTHRNKDGLTVPDTPARDETVIVVEDDLGSEPGISLEEEIGFSAVKVVAKVGQSEPMTLATSIQWDKETTGGVGPSVPVTPVAPVKCAQEIAGGGGLSAPMIHPGSGSTE